MCSEIQAVRDKLRDVRAGARADRGTLRAEARADREKFRNHILRLTERKSILRARIDGFRAPPATNP